jgi:hypothetical protein
MRERLLVLVALGQKLNTKAVLNDPKMKEHFRQKLIAKIEEGKRAMGLDLIVRSAYPSLSVCVCVFVCVWWVSFVVLKSRRTPEGAVASEKNTGIIQLYKMVISIYLYISRVRFSTADMHSTNNRRRCSRERQIAFRRAAIWAHFAETRRHLPTLRYRNFFFFFFCELLPPRTDLIHLRERNENNRDGLLTFATASRNGEEQSKQEERHDEAGEASLHGP